MDERQRRVGLNEVLFRDVNERLKEVGTSFSLVAETARFVCECGELGCAEPIEMTLAEYESLRADPKRFAVKPGHEITDVERVVEEREGYFIVEKLPGGPAGLAIREDPAS
jgi:hypothetical protein